MSTTKAIIKKCERCGDPFGCKTKSAHICPNCRKELAREGCKKSAQDREQGYRPTNRKNEAIIQEILKAEQYNKQHNTCLSYGKFVALNSAQS